MTPDVAADLAARVLAAIEDSYHSRADSDRYRVASDLAGLRLIARPMHAYPETFAELRAIFADGLLRTAALYGVTP